MTMGVAGKSFKFTYRNVTFSCKTIDDNSVCITSFTAGAADVVIPARVECVTLPASVKYVGKNAFRGTDDTPFTLPPPPASTHCAAARR